MAETSVNHSFLASQSVKDLKLQAMDIIKISAIVFLVILALAMTDSAVLPTEDSEFQTQEETPQETTKEPNYVSWQITPAHKNTNFWYTYLLGTFFG